MSDVHGNLSAMQAFLSLEIKADACILLGDLIDYGMHSNEIIEIVSEFVYPVICNIRGNHELAIMKNDYTRFSSERGRACAQYTASILSSAARKYIDENMIDNCIYEFKIGKMLCLAVHGSLADAAWGSIKAEYDLSAYKKYDYVFSGHSHMPHFFEKYYKTDNCEYRNRKKTIFINPGSLGQPRNHNPMAQFALLDTETEQIVFEKILYDVEKEQRDYTGEVDEFYKTRLRSGV